MNSILHKFEAFLLTEKRCALNTYHAYMRDMRQLVDFVVKKNRELSDTDGALLKEFIFELKKNETSAHSIARKISSLKIFFKWAHAQFSWQDHSKNLVFPKIEKKLPHYLSQEEVQQLLDAAQHDTTEIGKRNVVMLYLLYTTGVRVSELVSLKASSIEFDRGCLRVHGKGGKDRIVPLPLVMVSMLQVYLETVHKKFTQTYHTTDYLFPISYGKKVRPLTRQAFWLLLKELCKKTSLTRPISPHVLRHSLATHLLKNGANLRSLQLLLGHENLATVQIYTHVEVDHLRNVYDKKHPRR